MAVAGMPDGGRYAMYERLVPFTITVRVVFPRIPERIPQSPPSEPPPPPWPALEPLASPDALPSAPPLPFPSLPLEPPGPPDALPPLPPPLPEEGEPPPLEFVELELLPLPEEPPVGLPPAVPRPELLAQ
jgi:hypothetical protein